MMSIVSASMALMLASAPPPALAPAPLQGSGPWTVEFADRACAMGRKFDGVGGPVMLFVKAPLVGDNYEITTVAPANGKESNLRGEVSILGAEAGARSAEPIALSVFTSRARQRIARFSIDGERYTLRDAAPVFAIDMGKEGSQAFAVSGLSKALDKLEECTRGLRAEFGIDQASIDLAVTKPIANKSLFFVVGDYPVEALRKEEQGLVAVLGFVTPEGRFGECKVIESSKSRSLDETTCKVLTDRARYSPATDSAGRKLRYPVYGRITWILPDN